ncbi:phasin family protein [Rubrivirga sp. IMCC45206]|uniref:phasin family protein n=1 Tax=Rubrivirga sp. IMCC45206 TaxID=3391614 RepID=UPI0039902F35
MATATKTNAKKQANELQSEFKKTATDAVSTVKTTVETVQRDLTDAAGDVRDAVNKVFLAGLGALVVAEEEGSKTFKKLVKRGEKIDLPGFGADRVKAIREAVEEKADEATAAAKGRVQDAKYMAGETADKAEGQLSEAVTAVMTKLGVPTRKEISDLTKSVERLTDNIEKLKVERATSNELVLEAVGGGWYEIRLGDVVVEKVQGKEDAQAALIRIQEQRG